MICSIVLVKVVHYFKFSIYHNSVFGFTYINLDPHYFTADSSPFQASPLSLIGLLAWTQAPEYFRNRWGAWNTYNFNQYLDRLGHWNRIQEKLVGPKKILFNETGRSVSHTKCSKIFSDILHDGMELVSQKIFVSRFWICDIWKVWG